MRRLVLLALFGAACTGRHAERASDGGVDGTPPPGTCVAVRHLEARSTATPDDPARLSDGFAYLRGLTQPMFEWLLVDDAGASRRTQVEAPFFPYLKPTSVGTVQEPRLLLFDRFTDSTGTQIQVQVLRWDGTTLGPAASVLSVFDRGTAFYPLAAALDGHRAAVGNAHVGTRDPHFVLLDEDGRPVGSEIRLMETGDEPVFSCFTLTGTAHGVAGGVLDTPTGVFHMIELDAAAHIVNQATRPDTERCPAIRPFSDGVDVSFTIPTGAAAAGTTAVTRLSTGAFQPVATLPAPEAGSAYTWVAPGREPLVAITRQTSVSFARLRGGALVPLAGEFSRGTLVPSADDRIFLSRQDINFDVVPAETTASVVEIACADLAAPAD
jgi:hypothetical protein